MVTLNKEVISIMRETDVIPLHSKLREFAARIGMGLVNQTKLLTAASELARNMLKYAGSGKAIIELLSKTRDAGIRVTFEDRGPGIKDIDRAMQDGYSTGKSLGIGLPGAKRLVSEFEIVSEVGKGTTVTIIRWKNG